MGDSLPWAPMNRRARFDAASFIILGGEIRNHTNKHTDKQTHKETVNDTSTSCLSACMDNKNSV